MQKEVRNVAGLNGRDQGVGRIVIRLSTPLQLFNTLDPSPFRERELACEAERYIVHQVEDLSKAIPIEIGIYLASTGPTALAGPDLASAVSQHFRVRAEEKTLELRALLRTGRRSLAIGFAILAVCLTAGLIAGRILGDGHLPEVLRESFLILGWVAIWKPSEVFLYGWPEVVQERRLFERLAAAEVVLKSVPEPP